MAAKKEVTNVTEEAVSRKTEKEMRDKQIKEHIARKLKVLNEKSGAKAQQASARVVKMARKGVK